MSAPNLLHVWLHGSHVGELQRLRNGALRLRYDSEEVQNWGTGTRLLSYALPLTSKRVEAPALDAWLDNLLPEGALRVQLEQQHRVRPGDAFGLLTYLGAECAGAVQFTATDTPAEGRLIPLAEDEVARIVQDLPTLTAPEGESVSASLGGVQSKVLLTRTSSGWAWPAAGAMSTHIVKPEPIDPSVPIPRIIEYEHWAMSVALEAGVPAAHTELERFGERLALVVQRYDRTAGDRLHQEDFAQALGIRAGAKYEPAGDPGSRLATISSGPGAEAIDPARFRDDLLRLVTFNAIIGNGDAHAKNYSLILRDGAFQLAPAYDIAPVFCISSRFSTFGMRVAGQGNLKYLTPADLIEEAETWGTSTARARETVVRTAEAVSAAVPKVGGDSLLGAVATQVADRAAAFARP